jgi:hypothetical protein
MPTERWREEIIRLRANRRKEVDGMLNSVERVE